MSQRLGPISRRDLIKALRRHGWTGPWHPACILVACKQGPHMIRELSRGRSLPMPHRGRRLLAAVIAALLSTTLVMPAPASAQSTGVFLDGAEPWIASDCSGAVPIVVGSDAKAQSDIYSAVTLAGVIGTDCVVLAGHRNGDMADEQRARLDAAAAGGYVLGGTAAVPEARSPVVT